MSATEGPPGPPPGPGIDIGIPGIVETEEIGRGGFAVVYRGRRQGFDQSVAVKVLAAALDNESRQRFDREVRAMGALFGHPFIVGIITAGFTVADRPYIVMEDMTGGSLSDALRKRGPFSWQETVQIGDGLASALEAAHSAHVLHRDVKPENVLFSRYGAAKLSDFGLAAFTEGPETRSTTVMVSVAHTAPEVLDGAQRNASTDVYGLASTLMTMIIGRPPFARGPNESSSAIFKRISTEPPPDLRPQGVPDAVCRVLERALAKTPEQRYATASAFRADLERARTGTLPVAAAMPPVDSDLTETWVDPSHQTAPTGQSLLPPPPPPQGNMPPGQYGPIPMGPGPTRGPVAAGSGTATGRGRLSSSAMKLIAGGSIAALLVVYLLVAAVAKIFPFGSSHPTPPPPVAGFSAAAPVAKAGGDRLAEALLTRRFVASDLPHGWSVASTHLVAYAVRGLVADVETSLGGPAVNALVASFDVFDNAADAGTAVATFPPVPAGFTKVAAFTMTGLSDSHSCEVSTKPAAAGQTAFWSSACETLSANVETYVVVETITRSDATNEALARTLMLQTVHSLADVAASTPASAIPTSPATLSIDQTYIGLAQTSFTSDLVPPGMSVSGAPQILQVPDPATGLLPDDGIGNRIEINLTGQEVFDDIQYYVFDTPQDASTWFNMGLAPGGAKTNTTFDSSGFSQTSTCITVTLQTGDGASECYVLDGNTIVQGETVDSSSISRTAGNDALTEVLTRAGVIHLDRTDHAIS